MKLMFNGKSTEKARMEIRQENQKKGDVTMKKLCSVFIIFTLLLSFAACGGKNAENEDSSATVLQTGQLSSDSAEEPDSSVETSSEDLKQEDTGTKSLVVYFSCTGNTKAVAEKIAELTGSDLYEIVPEVPYTDDDLNYNNNNCRANKEMNDSSARPSIGSEAVDVSAYDTVFIGYPIWWGTMPRIINTFLDTYDLSGKTVMPFCTSGGSGVSKSVQDINSEEPDADVKEGLRAGGASDSSIVKWLDENGLTD